MTENTGQLQRLDTLLRTCIQCGLCLPHCATYLATGNEAESPRGRLLLLGEILQGRVATEDIDMINVFDTCLGCFACDSVCPSGISRELLAHVRELAADRLSVSYPVPVGILESRLQLGLLSRLATMVRAVVEKIAGAEWRRRFDTCAEPVARLGRMLGSLPASARDNTRLMDLLDELAHRSDRTLDSADSTERAGGLDGCPVGPTVAFFGGCANASLLPGTSSRLQDLLRAAGCEVIIPDGQECCGALAAHTGRHRRAHELTQKNMQVFGEAASFE